MPGPRGPGLGWHRSAFVGLLAALPHLVGERRGQPVARVLGSGKSAVGRDGAVELEDRQLLTADRTRLLGGNVAGDEPVRLDLYHRARQLVEPIEPGVVERAAEEHDIVGIHTGSLPTRSGRKPFWSP